MPHTCHRADSDLAVRATRWRAAANEMTRRCRFESRLHRRGFSERPSAATASEEMQDVHKDTRSVSRGAQDAPSARERAGTSRVVRGAVGSRASRAVLKLKARATLPATHCPSQPAPGAGMADGRDSSLAARPPTLRCAGAGGPPADRRRDGPRVPRYTGGERTCKRTTDSGSGRATYSRNAR
ncbi:hypothetical protein AcW1_002983 [Taiwanofungus camphoratus]|nr:hypothetical protein AcW1_002983 [Antrodia cinnamomea]